MCVFRGHVRGPDPESRLRVEIERRRVTRPSGDAARQTVARHRATGARGARETPWPCTLCQERRQTHRHEARTAPRERDTQLSTFGLRPLMGSIPRPPHMPGWATHSRGAEPRAEHGNNGGTRVHGTRQKSPSLAPTRAPPLALRATADPESRPCGNLPMRQRRLRQHLPMRDALTLLSRGCVRWERTCCS
jgi:hypothetical protein